MSQTRKPTLSLGPYFIPQAPQSPDLEFENAFLWPLNLALELATPKRLLSVELFRHAPRFDLPLQLRLKFGPRQSSLYDIVFHERQFPFSLRCIVAQIVNTPTGDFITLERLLTELYEKRWVTRPLLQVLRELEERANLPNPATLNCPQGLLIPSVEAEGFRMQETLLEAICPPADSAMAYMGIAWAPGPTAAKASASPLRFRMSQSKEILDQGDWHEPDFPCLGRLLTRELRRLAKGGTPLDLLTPAGRQAVRDRAEVVPGLPAPAPSATESPDEPPDETAT
jgi:hypothetical protein